MLVHPGMAETSDDGICKVKNEYEQTMWKMQYDTHWLKEVSLGKRVGLYRFSETIGSGNFSQVKLAVHLLTRDKVAVKIIDKTKLDFKTRKMISQEIKSMEAVHHPNIIRLLEVMDTYRKMYLVVEYAAGGPLYHAVSAGGPLAEPRARRYFMQVARAVLHMHKLGYVHRDIKAENVFLSSNNSVKLGDFGFSAHLNDDPNNKLNTFCGSPPYAAPELFRDESYCGRPVDVWALGVLLYFMLTATLPFRGASVGQLKVAILDGKYILPDTVPPHCKYIIENTLVQDATQRLCLSDIISNEWFNDPPPVQTYVRKNSLMMFAKKFRRNEAQTNQPRRRSILKDLELKRIPEIIKNNKTNDISIISARQSLGCDVTDGNQPKSTYSKGKSFDVGALPSTRPEEMLRGKYGEATELGHCVMSPTATAQLDQLGLLERTTRERLMQLGITSTLLLEHLAHGSNSPVIGVYRCTLNRIIEEQYVWESLNNMEVLMMSNGVNCDREEVDATDKGVLCSKLVKICAIL